MTTQPSVLTTSERSMLQRALFVDAGLSGLNGLGYLAGAMVLDELLGVATPWLLGLGAFLLVWATALTWVATRRPIRSGHVREIIVGNLVWAAGSIAVLVLADLTTVGAVWCVLQAMAVGAFAAAQLRLSAGAR